MGEANHPNIVTIHEIGRADSTHFIATEFIDCETLREHNAGPGGETQRSARHRHAIAVGNGGLSGEEKKQLAKQYTEKHRGLSAYILGRHYFNKNTKEGYEKSVEIKQQAIKKDPNYALAYTGLIYYFMGSRGFWTRKWLLDQEESDLKLEGAALKALELDDTLCECLLPCTPV